MWALTCLLRLTHHSAPTIKYAYAQPLQEGGLWLIEHNEANSGQTFTPGAHERASDAGACSYHGWRVEGRCDCFWGWEGGTCERRMKPEECLGPPCANCSAGVCFDPPADVRGRTPPFIYTYSLPPGFNALRPRVAIGRNTPYEFWRRLARSAHATTHAEEADYFFVPVSAMGVISHGIIPLALQYVSATWPWFNASRGRDHLVVAPWDFGASWLSQYPGVEHVRFVSHWGLTEKDTRYSNTCPLCGPSYVPGKDFVIPDMLETSYARQSPSGAARTVLLFFAGRSTTRIREALLAVQSNRSDVRVVSSGVSDLAMEMDRSRFCAGPPGAGFGTRASLAAARGCIPVLLGDNIAPVFDGFLDWSEFSISVPEKDIPRIVDIVAAVPPQEEARLRAGLSRVSRHFVWNEVDDQDAFETTMRYLLKFKSGAAVT